VRVAKVCDIGFAFGRQPSVFNGPHSGLRLAAPIDIDHQV
jgi:hypothetical protein